jgi:hypothetical protein
MLSGIGMTTTATSIATGLGVVRILAGISFFSSDKISQSTDGIIVFSFCHVHQRRPVNLAMIIADDVTVIDDRDHIRNSKG